MIHGGAILFVYNQKVRKKACLPSMYRIGVDENASTIPFIIQLNMWMINHLANVGSCVDFKYAWMMPFPKRRTRRRAKFPRIEDPGHPLPSRHVYKPPSFFISLYIYKRVPKLRTL